MPHIASELWEVTGHAGVLDAEPWPLPDPEALVEAVLELPVQVNGNDLLNSLLLLIGPNAKEGLETFQKNAGQSGKGAYIQGYDQFDVTQFQVNGRFDELL